MDHDSGVPPVRVPGHEHRKAALPKGPLTWSAVKSCRSRQEAWTVPAASASSFGSCGRQAEGDYSGALPPLAEETGGNVVDRSSLGRGTEANGDSVNQPGA